jgi:YidC/Oxa1 family membrane protein insertase
MDIWIYWTQFLANSINYFSVHFGLSEAVSIILLTLFLRILLFPLSYSTAYKSYKNKSAIARLKPEIDKIKEMYKDHPSEIMQKTMSLYKKNNINLFQKSTIYNFVLQATFGIGAFQTIRNMALSSKFLWIANIAKPDILLALLVGILTFLSMSMMPGSAEQNMTLFYMIPAIISVVVLITFPSGLGIYWAISNLVAISQQLILRFVISRESQIKPIL